MITESASITPFTLAIPDADLEDLRQRLARTRWPTEETVDDWSQGVPLAYAREICDYWAAGYDWRKVEAELNALDQFTTTIDGLDIHFIHVRSPVEDAPGSHGDGRAWTRLRRGAHPPRSTSFRL
jgi:epoxide hydrolase